MAAKQEMILYYTPEKSDADRKLKGVLVRLGIRIKNITPEQVTQSVGFLAGLQGFDEQPVPEGEDLPVIPEKMLIMYGFGRSMMDILLREIRRAGVPPIPMKAVITQYNCEWKLSDLYRELRKEYAYMTGQDDDGESGTTGV